MKTLTIKWQRLVVGEGGQTCTRCGSTEKELDRAVGTLSQSLAPLGIEVDLEKKALDPATFAQGVLESNRIWIGGKPMEEWLEAEVSQSPCCEVCGNAECRTVKVGEKSYETIPVKLILKAGLVAAAGLIAADPKEPSAQDQPALKTPSAACCPDSAEPSAKCG